MNEKDFRARLAKRQKIARTLLCVGLDPDYNEMPEHLKMEMDDLMDDEDKAEVVVNWATEIVDATAPFTCMYKPQIAHWEALGTSGLQALSEVVAYIKGMYPNIPVFLDCKRGDIDNTQDKYRIACFEKYGVDGMNFSPYMGKSCMKALCDKSHPERALVGLCFTSNTDARETQDVKLENGDFYWEYIAKCTLGWAGELAKEFGQGVLDNAGIVMAAAFVNKNDPEKIVHNRHLLEGRNIVGDKLWFLIPGIGRQGGELEETVVSSFMGWGSIAINESRSVIFAGTGEDFAEAAGLAAKKSSEAMMQFIHVGL